jgi:hypothetical protein
MGKEKVTKKLKISQGRKKLDPLFNEWDPKYNEFNEKRKRHSCNREEILDTDDIIKRNSIISTEKSKREIIRRRVIKKRVSSRKAKEEKTL